MARRFNVRLTPPLTSPAGNGIGEVFVHYQCFQKCAPDGGEFGLILGPEIEDNDCQRTARAGKADARAGLVRVRRIVKLHLDPGGLLGWPEQLNCRAVANHRPRIRGCEAGDVCQQKVEGRTGDAWRSQPGGQDEAASVIRRRLPGKPDMFFVHGQCPVCRKFESNSAVVDDEYSIAWPCLPDLRTFELKNVLAHGVALSRRWATARVRRMKEIAFEESTKSAILRKSYRAFRGLLACRGDLGRNQRAVEKAPVRRGHSNQRQHVDVF